MIATAALAFALPGQSNPFDTFTLFPFGNEMGRVAERYALFLWARYVKRLLVAHKAQCELGYNISKNETKWTL